MPICPVEFKTKSQFRQIDIQFFPAEYGFVVIYYISFIDASYIVFLAVPACWNRNSIPDCRTYIPSSCE